MSLSLAFIQELDDEALKILAVKLAPMLGLQAPGPATEDSWMDTARAAAYLGITKSALNNRTAAREVPFEQDGPGCKCWFKRSQLDAWREGTWKR
jgi:hypothetical protein